MTQLQLNVLGLPTVRIVQDDDNNAVSQFASNKVQAILIYIAVTGKPCSRDTLLGLLWPDAPTDKARTSLRSALYNLQKQLPNALAVSRKSVAIAPDCQLELDSATFSAGATANANADGDMDTMRQAMALYKGDFLAGFHIDDAPDFEYWRVVEQERLRHLAVTGLERLAAHDERLGDTAAAIDSLRRLLALEAWRESTHRHIMLLLARAGNYNGAIKQYQQCCAMLDEELGVPPMPETAALHQRIITLRGQPPAVQLPTPSTALVGREQELVALTNLLAATDCRLIAITGMGGMGKTSLAMALAVQHARHFLDGVFFIPLSGLESDLLLETAVFNALNLPIPPNTNLRQHLCQHLADKEMLLILDNAEQLLTAVTTLTQALLQAAPALKIVITSREKPRLRAVNAFALAGLGEEAATALFAQNARRTRHDFVLDDLLPSVAELCNLVDGSPLGIELAAAQLDSTTCTELTANLRRTIAELAVDFVDMPPRHRSLRAMFLHSWQLLSATEQTALAALSVFHGGFTKEAAHHVGSITAATLRELMAKSLLYAKNDRAERVATKHSRSSRFSLHHLVREFAREQLSALASTSPITADPIAAHAHYFSQQLAEQPDKLLIERGNIRAMWQYAITHNHTLLAESTHGLARFYAINNLFTEGRVQFQLAITTLDNGSSSAAVMGSLLGRYAMFLLRTGQLTDARAMADRSVALLRDVNDDMALGFSLNLLGISHLQSGEFETAVSLLTDCATAYRRADTTKHLLKPLINLGSVQIRMGNYEDAIAHLNEALPIAHAQGDQRGLTHIHNNLGATHLALGDLDAAYAQFAACLPLTEETAYQPVRLVALQNLAEVAYKRNDWASAIAHCEESIAIALELDDAVQAIRTQKVQAMALYAMGDAAQAWPLLHHAVTVGHEAQALPALMDVLEGVGVLLLADGQIDLAVELLQFVRDHPATEKQFVTQVEGALKSYAFAKSDASLAGIITAVLQTIPE